MVKVYKTFSGYGVDVTEHRADDLDKLCLERVRNLSHPHVWDLGCGAGGQSLRLAQAGASVLAVDGYDFSAQFAHLMKENPQLKSPISFVQSDIASFSDKTHSAVDCVLFQRTIHYLPYQEASKVLKKLASVTKDSLYISVTGIDSAVGEGYAGKEVAIRDRFFALNAVQAEKFLISQPVCLYTPAEYTALLTESGWKIDQLWESAFGNIKAVCTMS